MSLLTQEVWKVKSFTSELPVSLKLIYQIREFRYTDHKDLGVVSAQNTLFQSMESYFVSKMLIELSPINTLTVFLSGLQIMLFTDAQIWIITTSTLPTQIADTLL